MAALGRFLFRSADKSLHFFRALKQSTFEWDRSAEEAFQQLKSHLATLPKLVSPLPGETLFVYLAVSEHALSVVLVAEREKNQHPLYFISHAFRGAEPKYPPIEKMIFALVLATRKLKSYFQAHPIKVLTSQLIRKVIEGKNQSSRVTDWANQTSDICIEFEPRRAIKAQALADIIAECTSRPESTEEGCGAGLLILDPQKNRTEYAIKFDFTTSNNEAEYEALLLGIQLCKTTGARKLRAYSDSQLIVGQVTGEFEAKEDSMKMYLRKVKEEISGLSLFTITHIPRSENQQEDALSRLASSAEDLSPRPIMWKVLEAHNINREVTTLDRSPTWMDKIISFSQDGILPEDELEVEKIRRWARWFTYHEGQLYKKSFTHPLLRCLTPQEGAYVLREIHQGACVSHQGARTITAKALQAGYYSPTMREDALKMVQKCKDCQMHANLPHQAASSLTTIQAPLPFDMWGMDLLGPFPPASRQRRFLLVAVDYFTKWVEAAHLASITDKQVQQFIWQHLITRFEVPRVLIPNNGQQLNSGPTRDYYSKFGIETRFSVVSRPQTNGQEEAAN
ncbi:uncharacterized protein LOC125493585 [Beta vulgaris subsp. vulgaris]|uniref:uncharacterized protein LOC125493585 n=1 Tax=Beta vulgaris subsp. vulgaris TaxID=3555 RepID=UPI0020366DE4|nr:uncharacterized protein LOC125493585 [Beta vulgaris subsp. vulgaris]